MNAFLLTTFAAEDATGIGALGLDLKVILLQAGAFIILYLIFKKYVLGKVVKVLEDRHEKIEESLKTAEEIEKRSEQTNQEAEKIVAKARSDAETVIAKAHDEASDMIKEAESLATKKQEKMLSEAEAKIEADVKKAKSELKSELLSLVGEATEIVLQEKLDTPKDQELIKRALSEVKS